MLISGSDLQLATRCNGPQRQLAVAKNEKLLPERFVHHFLLMRKRVTDAFNDKIRFILFNAAESWQPETKPSSSSTAEMTESVQKRVDVMI